MLTTEQLKELRARLDMTLVDIKEELGEIETDKGEPKMPEFGSDTESSEDSPEEADEAEELATNVAIADGLKARMEDVQNALRKMDKGEYGKCEKCGMDIDYEVLKANPESRLCKHCKAGV